MKTYVVELQTVETHPPKPDSFEETETVYFQTLGVFSTQEKAKECIKAQTEFMRSGDSGTRGYAEKEDRVFGVVGRTRYLFRIREFELDRRFATVDTNEEG